MPNYKSNPFAKQNNSARFAKAREGLIIKCILCQLVVL